MSIKAAGYTLCLKSLISKIFIQAGKNALMLHYTHTGICEESPQIV